MSVRRLLPGILLLLAGLAASVEAGQPERPKWWLSAQMRAELGLTDEQSQQIEDVFQSVLPRMRAEKEALDREDAVLSRLMVDGADERAIGHAIDRVEAARSAAGKTRTWMLVRMYRVLSPEQRAKVQAMHEQHQRRRDARPGSAADRP